MGRIQFIETYDWRKLNKPSINLLILLQYSQKMNGLQNKNENQLPKQASNEQGDFLQQMLQDPRVQNQLIPKVWRPVTSKQLISTFIEQYLTSKPPGKAVPEIELRFGTHSITQINSEFRSTAFEKTTRDLSFQNPVIVACTSPHLRQQLRIKPGSHCALQGVEHKFTPGVDFHMFQNRIDVIDQLGRFDLKEQIFTVDYMVKNDTAFSSLGQQAIPQQQKGKRPQRTNKRITYDVTNAKFLETVKYEKNNLDIVHQNIDYRISGAYEENEEISPEMFHKNVRPQDIGLVRVKVRKNFNFQFMQFSFTKVYPITDKGTINALFFTAKQQCQTEFSLTPEQTASRFLSQITSVIAEPELEVEVEISNPQYLRQTIIEKPHEFDFIVNRFLRNSELLRSYPDQFFQMNYVGLFDKQDQNHLMFPIIGEYINSLNSGDYYFRNDFAKSSQDQDQGKRETNELQ